MDRGSRSRTDGRACADVRRFTCATFETKTAFDHEGLAALVARLNNHSPIVLSAGVTPLKFEVLCDTETQLPKK